ncbi:hypothetical protein ACIQTZ_14080 [Paenarthrobacter sp. NPDC090520]|uniref:hypothetical protein n=1 Tax=unclassified Paenarthrobacter TaxID=2634190 RepID=UPI0038148CA6
MGNILRGGIAAVLAALLVVVLGVQPAQASWYDYLVGHPLYRGVPWAIRCTGSYVIYGSSGTFILTAGHCFNPAERVYGTSAGFGTIAYQKWTTTTGDSELIQTDSGVTMYQTIVDPTTGIGPGPNNSGHVTGKMSNDEQTYGTLVGKMGVATGKTEGTIQYRYVPWNGLTAYCATYARATHDSGGPVWRWDSQGLRAVGMHVGRLDYEGATYGCYLPIDTLLSQWGASMNFWPISAARGQAPSEDLMPESDSTELPPILTVADGAVWQND